MSVKEQNTPQPSHFPVAVILEKRALNDNPWVDHTWSAVGITVGRYGQQDNGNPVLVREGAGRSNSISHYLVSGLQVCLYADECESYYHNMMTKTPRCYVVAHLEDSGEMPEPFMVSMGFDEAHAYLEGDDEIYAVDVPPELYRWTEAFVLANYFPEKKTKRKLRNWSQPDDRGCAS